METKSKRKALAEITNIDNRIPTAILKKLVDSQNKTPISILKPISSSTNPKFLANELSDIRSEACSNSSISSNYVSNTRNVHFKTPPISPGDVMSKDAGQYKMLNVEKYGKATGADVVSTHHTSVEKKDKEKATDAALFPHRPMKVTDNENVSTSLSSSLEKTKQKGKSNFIVLDEPAQNVKKSVKGFSNPSRCSNEKPDKGKTIDIPPVPLGFETADMKEFEKTYNRSGSKTHSKKKESRRPSGIMVGESREAASEFLNSSKSGDRTKGKDNALSNFASLLRATKDKDTALSNFASLLRATKDKGKTILHSTCPPKLRPMDYDSDGDGNSDPLKSWTDPPRKRRCLKKEKKVIELPREYIEQQNAYFKEVDSFELLEEEVSEDELD